MSLRTFSFIMSVKPSWGQMATLSLKSTVKERKGGTQEKTEKAGKKGRKGEEGRA